MNALEFLNINMGKALNYAIEQFRAELRNQGHRASGRLEESFTKVITIKLNDFAKGEILAEEYGEYLDRGVKPNRIRYNPMVLIPWIRIIKPGLSPSEQKSFAYAIKGKQEQEGMPTRNSYSYSRNGRRKAYKENALKGKDKEMDNIINLAGFLQLLVDEELTEFKNAA